MDAEIAVLKGHISDHCTMAQEQREKNVAYDLVINQHMEKIKQLEELSSNQNATIESMLRTIENLTAQLLTLQKYVSKDF